MSTYQLENCPACDGRRGSPSSCAQCYGTGKLQSAAAAILRERVQAHLEPASEKPAEDWTWLDGAPDEQE